MVHELVCWFGDTLEQTVQLTAAPPLVFPSVDQLRTFRGDFCGIRVPELLQYGSSDVFFTDIYPAYPDDLRAKLRQIYRSRGYTHFPIATAGGYHGVYPSYDLTPDPARLRAILTELWQDGLIPVLFMIDDGHWPDGSFQSGDTGGVMAAVAAKYDPVFAACGDLVKIAVPGWEYNGFMTPALMTATARYLKSKVPDALVYVHFTAGHAAGSGPNETEAGWWASMQGTLQGILYQANGNDGGQAISDRLADFTIRFQTGYHSWPTGFDTVLFEYAAYWEVWDHNPESWGIEIGNACLQKTNPRIQGFCNGGDPGLVPPLPGQASPTPPFAPQPAPGGGVSLPPLDAAAIVASQIPGSSAAGSPVTWSIMVENTGTTTWTSDAWKLGVLDGNGTPFVQAQGDPNRVWLSPGETVPPGASVTFTFTVPSPGPGTYPVRLQMVHEGVEWFGNVLDMNVTVN